MLTVASDSQSSQSACRGELAAIDSAAGTLDSIPSRSASLPSRTFCRQTSEVRAGCVNAPVRICAGGGQKWPSLPRQVDLGCEVRALRRNCRCNDAMISSGTLPRKENRGKRRASTTAIQSVFSAASPKRPARKRQDLARSALAGRPFDSRQRYQFLIESRELGRYARRFRWNQSDIWAVILRRQQIGGPTLGYAEYLASPGNMRDRLVNATPPLQVGPSQPSPSYFPSICCNFCTRRLRSGSSLANLAFK
jgi:hypothetical protein